MFAMVLAVLLVGGPTARATGAEPPDFKEVSDLVRAHLKGMSEAELNRAAVQGLLAQLGHKASLVSESAESSIGSGPLVSKSAAFEAAFGYLRIGRVGNGLAKEIAAAYKQLSGTNQLKGLVLDLRFTDGQGYSAAGEAADLFLSTEQPLLDWGTGSFQSKAKTNAVRLPVAVLVNEKTEGAAEALAAVLRETGAGLVLGTNTAGEAVIAEEFPLKNGQRLRIATAGIRLGSGEVLSAHGVKPDIEVAVGAEEEKVFWADPFKELQATNLVVSATAVGTNESANGTNRPSRRRVTEADLVRERREGASREPVATGTIAKVTEPETPVVRDPALARALDLLKGLAVVRQLRSP